MLTSSKKKEPVHVVSTDLLPGHTVVEVKGMVWASSVRSRFISQDIRAFLKTISGGRIKSYEALLNDARADVVRRVAANASKIGANAVIGFKLTSTQVMSGTVELLGYGTAVVVKKGSNARK